MPGHQRASGSIRGGIPAAPAEGKDAALGGFRGMDGAAVRAQELIQGMARHSQAHAVVVR